MPVTIPVYSDQNGVHRVEIFRETDEGAFRRTGQEPLRALRENIVGVTPSIGELVSDRYDRTQRCWSVPTVKPHGERAQSLYQFLRAQAKRRKLYVFSRESLSGKLVKFDLHELRLKPTASPQVVSLLTRRYCEAIDLWLEHQQSAQDESRHTPV